MTTSGMAPAFPTEIAPGRYMGMDLRTYIATQVMSGLLASDIESTLPVENAAKLAVHGADALIAELNK